MIEIGKDYKFRDDMIKSESNDTVPIEILTPPYNGVILRFTKVAVKELENGTAVLQFEYDLVDAGEHSETKLRSEERFHRHLSVLLNHLILESVEGNDDADPVET